MKAYIVYNPVAGQRDVHEEIAQVSRYLQDQGWQVKAKETHASGDAIRWASEAVDDGCRIVFAAGGDGTLNEVVNGVAGSGVAVAILPIGTGNVWAKEIGVPVSTSLHPSHLLDAVKAIEDGIVCSVDIGKANGRYFLLWAGVGFDAQIVEEVEPQFETKRRWGMLAFIVAGVSIALDFAGTGTSLTIDDRTFRQRVMLILISNTQSYGGGLLRVAPQACLDDGWLDVYVFEGQGPLSTVHHVASMLARQHLRDPRVIYHQAQRLRVETNKSMPVHVDGVPVGGTPLEVQLVPRGLKVVVPRKVPKRLFVDLDNTGIPLREFLC